MDTKILFNYVKILEKYIEYTNQYNNIKYNKEIFDNGFVLLSNVFLLLFKDNHNKDSIYHLLNKSYIYYIEFFNNIDLLNISQNNDNSTIQIANIFCIKKIFSNLNKENNIEYNMENNYINDNEFYENLYLSVNIITNIYIKIYCYFNSYTERYIFNNFIIDYILSIIKKNNNSDNKLEKLLLNINNNTLNQEIKEVIDKYNNNYTLT
tara:strand:- start:58 stop:681 length:624 start_codon:yes stop_codon:yes gene_type:complete